MNGGKQRHRFLAACDAVARKAGFTLEQIEKLRPRVRFEVKGSGSRRTVELRGGTEHGKTHRHVVYDTLLGYGGSRREAVDMAIGALRRVNAERLDAPAGAA